MLRGQGHTWIEIILHVYSKAYRRLLNFLVQFKILRTGVNKSREILLNYVVRVVKVRQNDKRGRLSNQVSTIGDGTD